MSNKVVGYLPGCDVMRSLCQASILRVAQDTQSVNHRASNSDGTKAVFLVCLVVFTVLSKPFLIMSIDEIVLNGFGIHFPIIYSWFNLAKYMLKLMVVRLHVLQC